MDIESGLNPDLQTQVAVANTVRKGRKVFLGCCKGEKTDKGVTGTPKSLVDIVALAGFGVSFFAMFTTSVLLIDITGALVLVFTPYLVFQKRILNKLGTFRDLHNLLRSKVNELMLENNKLTANVDRLDGSVTELEQIESELASIANTDNVDRLVYVVSETKRINQKMKKNTQAKIVQQLITTVLRTDRDLDLKIGPIELKNLMMRLDHQPGFDFHADRFMNLLGNTDEPVPIENIMRVIRNLKDDSVPEEENIFTIRPETLVQMSPNSRKKASRF
mmetsp:Transcript_16962/g.21462  ORF Transcript_16962/g.21462 Transcript_16962/m.21462 type:complete len:276 (-) Transcript_16962:228-1055(-)